MHCDYYIVFDLEATCWENDKSKISEIIEIGAVKLNKQIEIIDNYDAFVKPTINPILSDFCMNLSPIAQKDVNDAKPFAESMRDFEDWIVSSGNNIILCSYGAYDKNQIIRESETKKYSRRILQLLDHHINIKEEFAKWKNIKPCGMAQALRKLNIPLEGIHHRALDDAMNIAKIFKIVYGRMLNKNKFH